MSDRIGVFRCDRVARSPQMPESPIESPDFERIVGILFFDWPAPRLVGLPSLMFPLTPFRPWISTRRPQIGIAEASASASTSARAAFGGG